MFIAHNKVGYALYIFIAASYILTRICHEISQKKICQ